MQPIMSRRKRTRRVTAITPDTDTIPISATAALDV
jgi:hypothetical protein